MRKVVPIVKKYIGWLVWFLLATTLFFIGWAIRDDWSKHLGRAIMSLGFLLCGFLLVYFAYKNLNNKL